MPTYPGFEIEVEALREKPEIIAEASVPATLDHLSEVVEGLDRSPIIMGHSFGGIFTQLLVNRGLGVAAVTIDSAPPEGVRVNPPSQIKSLFPFLANPANRHRAVGFTKEQFHYAFANTGTREESDAVYDRLHIPAPGNWVGVRPDSHLEAGPPGDLGRLRPGRPRSTDKPLGLLLLRVVDTLTRER